MNDNQNNILNTDPADKLDSMAAGYIGYAGEAARSLAGLQPGESAYVREVLATGCQRRRLLDIGLVRRTRVECLGKSPAGDPAAYLIRGAVIALRAEDSARILLGD